MLGNDFGRELYHKYASGAPIVDFHNHLDVNDILEDRKHSNIAELWVCADKYKHRAMRIAGISERLITGKAPAKEKFQAWCGLMPYTMFNPLFHWSCLEMKNIFGIDEVPSKDNWEEIWEVCNTKLSTDDFSTNSILRRMNVKSLTTSNDAMEDVSVHSRASRKSSMCVAPSLRADSIVDFKLAGAPDSLDEYLELVKSRLDSFAGNGCRLSDHALDNGFFYARTSRQEADGLYARLTNGGAIGKTELLRLKSFMLDFLAREYARRGWVMQLHIGAERWTSTRLRRISGPTGGYAGIGNSCCLRAVCDFLDGLDADGLMPKTILYTLNPSDNAMLATLTGSFSESGVQKLQFGPAWWYNDHECGIRDNLDALGSYSLMSMSLGMTTDSRTILSFSRHDYFRRILCDYIGNRVERGVLPADMEFLGGVVTGISYKNADKWIYGNE